MDIESVRTIRSDTKTITKCLRDILRRADDQEGLKCVTKLHCLVFVQLFMKAESEGKGIVGAKRH